MTVFLWATQRSPVEPADFLQRVEGLTYVGGKPCDSALVIMLDDISRRILKDPISRRAPQYVALAYWLRRAALTRLTSELRDGEKAGHIRTPRGIALHLPPTNVDTIFVYSWAMSVLAGNANVVRLPETLSAETEWLVSTIASVVAEHGEQQRQLFCHYPYGGTLEVELSRLCDLRMIWGGDEKVKAVSRCPVRPDGLSIGFPDRKSLAAIDVQAYQGAGENERNALAERFYNDLFWFDQMGCGSPRLLVWLGDPEGMAEDFYARLKSVITAKSYSVETGITIGKLALSHDLLVEGVSSRHRSFDNALHVNRVVDPLMALGRSYGGGFLCDYVVPSLLDVAEFVTRSIQTITHFGISNESLVQFAGNLRGRGGYRLVPIGQALQFDTTWDGIDLYEHMTRHILIR